jgi:hypothetical protein
MVLRGDPDQQQAPEPILYVKFKPGADQSGIEKQIRLDEGENNPAAMEISHDGDFMVLRKKGQELPSAGSPERTKLFATAMGDSDKAAVGALIFNDAMKKSLREKIGSVAPPGLVTILADSQWIRTEFTLGEGVKLVFTMQTADEETGTRVADGVTGLHDALKAQVAQMKQAFAQLPPQVLAQLGTMGDVADAMVMLVEALKPTQAGATVTVTLDAKAVGGLCMGFFAVQTMQGPAAPAKKGGL